MSGTEIHQLMRCPVPYAMSGTEIGYADGTRTQDPSETSARFGGSSPSRPTRSLCDVRYWYNVCLSSYACAMRYAMSGTGLGDVTARYGLPTRALRDVRYHAMSGTDKGYAATRSEGR
eukprot:434515-Rhodomonas_salina.1